MTQREQQLLGWIRENPMISQQELADRAGITRSSVGVHISNLMKKGCITGRGYILGSEKYVVVIGGVNIDVGGAPEKKLVHGDSNPGSVRTSLGGVGRNISHNMSLMGLSVSLLTVFGDDMNAQKIIESCASLGIDVSQSPLLSGSRTSTYLFINNELGDMQLAVSDMAIYDRLTPQLLESRRKLINGAAAVVFDTNIPQSSIEYLAGSCTVPLFADPVSTAKAEKLRPVLGRLHTLKPNRIEAEMLSGVEIRGEDDMRRAAARLLDTGLERVFITLGSDGVYAADHNRGVHLPGIRGEMVNTTGCGDAFTAALVWAQLGGLSLEQSARAGLAAAAIAMESEETINSAMSESALTARMKYTEVNCNA